MQQAFMQELRNKYLSVGGACNYAQNPSKEAPYRKRQCEAGRT